MTTNSPDSIVDANVVVHSAMAATYNEREPHFRPENQAKVRQVLQQVAQDTGGGRLIDFGCGTGFIINLAKDLFREIDGVDITQAMLDRVDLSSGNIRLHNQRCENVPFEAGTFDAATAYSFLDHLADYSLVLREAHRVLRPGGKMYIDLLPNKAFWDEINVVGERDGIDGVEAPIVNREVTMLISQHEMVERDYNIDGQTFLAAEPWKTATRGISSREFTRIAQDIGFAKVDLTFQWYLGQGNVLHGQGESDAKIVEDYLRSVLPVSESLFKYLRVVLTR
ncbi:MAG: class I SAM-dependent methyltransferase [Pseudoxanthomonas sp.]